MNLPNKLTLLRVFLVPVFVIFVLYPQIPLHYLWALLVFLGASLTDHYDGKIARDRNLITNFGKFLDPLADKILVISALICFMQIGFASVWCVLIVIARELMVTSIRLLAVEGNGTVIAANQWGKVKTASQMVSIVFILLFCSIQEILKTSVGADSLLIVGNILIWITTLLTLVSGIIYLKQNIHLINTTK